MGRRNRITDTESWRFETDWRREFRIKESVLSEHYNEVEPAEFIREIFPEETLSTSHRKEEHNTGRPCGILKYCTGTNCDGKVKMQKVLLCDDYKALEHTQNNRFALLGLCTYFGMQGSKNAHPSQCHGLSIDLDAVREKELFALMNMFAEKLAPVPTYLVNSGHGLHLYYVFEQPISLKDVETVTLLNKVKAKLTELLWNDKTSADSYRQYQTIFQDMRIPGSWTKFGMRNKGRCSYILRAYRTGEQVDLTYLTREMREYFPRLAEDWASISTKRRIPLEEAKKLYPTWYKRVVVEGHESGYYIQKQGLYEWWLNIITQDTDRPVKTSREGNRWNCVAVLFVMAKKCGISFEQALLDAIDLIPTMNEKEHAPDNEFTYDDVYSAMEYYNKKYVRWSNKTISERCSIELPPSQSRRNGRTQTEHLRRARALRQFASYESVGRPSKQNLVREWREQHPNGTKAACIRELQLDKKTVYRWWAP